MVDREPQPTDGPEYHERHKAWQERQKKRSVELRIYNHTFDVVEIEGFEANDWGEFVIIAGDLANMGLNDQVQLSDALSSLSNETGKKYIILDRELDLTFHGIEKIEED